VNRFFSKLNLQDIKINPEGNRFPPDEDEHEDQQTAIEEPQAFETGPADPEPEPASNGYAPSWSAPSAPVEREIEAETERVDAEPEVATLPVEDVAPANGHANGHAVEVTPVEIIADGEVIGVVGEVLKVSARSRPSAVAGAIAGVVRESGRAEVQAIGAGATNQAVKAVAIARDYLSETGIEAVCLPAFIDVTIENEDRTAIRLVVEPR
jgi:stage V sporulation protein S